MNIMIAAWMMIYLKHRSLKRVYLKERIMIIRPHFQSYPQNRSRNITEEYPEQQLTVPIAILL